MNTWLVVYLIVAGAWLFAFAFAAFVSVQLGERDQGRALARVAIAAPGWPLGILCGAVLFVRFAVGKDVTR
mgnify:CR=1 FL=1